MSLIPIVILVLRIKSGLILKHFIDLQLLFVPFDKNSSTKRKVGAVIILFYRDKYR